jgi:hypothetical protein
LALFDGLVDSGPRTRPRPLRKMYISHWAEWA